jgi:hypothetical protein
LKWSLRGMIACFSVLVLVLVLLVLMCRYANADLLLFWLIRWF